MLTSFWGRLTGREPTPLAVSAGHAALPLPADGPVFVASRPPREAATVTKLPGPAPLPGLGARRPLVSADGHLAGFEFHVGARQLTAGQLRRPELIRSSAQAVLGAMRQAIEQGQFAVAELPVSWLLNCDGDKLFAPGMHLVLGPDMLQCRPDDLAELVVRLRQAGVKLGWAPAWHARGGPAGQPDFIVLPRSDNPAGDSWPEAVAAAASYWPDLPLLLLDLPDVAELEAVLAPPVALALCHAPLGSTAAQEMPLGPLAERLLALLGRLSRKDGQAALLADLKADAGLSHRLLDCINSVNATPARPIKSLDEALILLGRDHIHHWVARLLLLQAPTRAAAGGLQSLALARARLIELLAMAKHEALPGALYLTGLAASLPLLLQCSVDDALAPMLLPAEAIAAVGEQAGPWLHYLALVKALERMDLVAAEALSHPFGGLEAVLALAAKAWLPG